MSTDLTETKPEPKPETKAIIRSGNRGLMLASLDDMWRASQAFHRSGLFLRTHDTVEKTFVAIQCGAEVGLAPVQSLMSIAVIQGRPTIWGDALPGLVWASGLMESFVETIEGEGDAMVARCVAVRKGATEPIERTFSVDDAKTAKLWQKPGPWVTNPKRMLQMRARGFTLRDGFADVLKGLQVREEVLDYSDSGETTAGTQPANLTARLSMTLPESPVEPTGGEE